MSNRQKFSSAVFFHRRLFRLGQYAFATASLLLAGSMALRADNSVFYQDLASAIQSANTQADVTLMKGYWRTIVGSSTVIWNIPTLDRATLMLNYDNGILRNSSFQFTTKISAVVKAAGGICTDVSIGTLRFDDAGRMDPTSDVQITGPSSCKDPGGLVAIGDHLRLTQDPKMLFTGRLFQGLIQPINGAPPNGGKLPPVSKCNDPDCKTFESSKGPISNIEFFDQGNDKAGFAAQFRPNSTIHFPIEGFLTVRAGSVIVPRLTYDVVNERGYGTLGLFDVVIAQANIVAGQTRLVVPVSQSSRITFSNFALAQDGQTLEFTSGNFDGQLDVGSTISVGGSNTQQSVLQVQQAAVHLNGIDLKYSSAGKELTAKGGSVVGLFQQASIWFRKSSYINLLATNLNFNFGCAANDNSPTCYPAYWGPSGTKISGYIDKFSTAISGGQFEISGDGSIRIDSGNIACAGLFVDTRQESTPVRGQLTSLTLNFSAQDLAIDKSNKITAGQLSLASNNLTFENDDPYPVGTSSLTGSVTGVYGPVVGSVPIASTTFSATLSRTANDSIRVSDGTLNGKFNVYFGDGGTGSVQFSVSELRYYKGQGDGILNMTGTNFSYTVNTPGKTIDDGAVSATVYSVPIGLSLGNPFRVVNAVLRAENGNWRLDQQSSAINVAAHVPQMKVVEANVDEVIHICTATATAKDHVYTLQGQATYQISSTQKSVTVGSFTLNDPLEFDTDAASCQRVAILVCGIVGSMTPLGPIGLLGGAYICGKGVDDFVKKESDQFRSDVGNKVQNFQFQVVR